MQAEIYHLFHSGTAVRLGDRLFIFDYFKDQNQNKNKMNSSLENGLVNEKTFAGINQSYVFVSHSHHDHYNSVIFDWQKHCSDINYILAKEIALEKNLDSKDNICFLEKGDQLALKDIKIEAYGSTDQGVSFLLRLEDLNIFHAGDLNWWKWKKFSEKVQAREEREYKREVDKLKDREIDIAFIPVDPRLEEYYYLAGEYFIEQIRPSLFVPIHFGDNYDITRFFKEKFNSNQTRVAEIKKQGEKILYTKK